MKGKLYDRFLELEVHRMRPPSMAKLGEKGPLPHATLEPPQTQ
jgi:hypothetical protein